MYSGRANYWLQINFCSTFSIIGYLLNLDDGMGISSSELGTHWIDLKEFHRHFFLFRKLISDSDDSETAMTLAEDRDDQKMVSRQAGWIRSNLIRLYTNVTIFARRRSVSLHVTARTIPASFLPALHASARYLHATARHCTLPVFSVIGLFYPSSRKWW